MATDEIKNYSSIYNIKDYTLKNIVPNYFDIADVNDLNVGLLGYVTEISSVSLEDSLNTTTTYIKEMFPNTAMLPESMYNFAALFKMDNLFASPAVMETFLIISEDDILKHMKPNASGEVYEFVIDSDLIIDVEGVHFMLDYDIVIQVVPKRGTNVFSAYYDFTFVNSLNTNTEAPYIKTMEYFLNDLKYLFLIVKVHQVDKFRTEDTIISNNVLNYPRFEVQYEENIANVEIYYKPPTGTKYTQLKKLLKNSPPVQSPFCYYSFLDENRIEISFSGKNKYFQPEFKSDVIIDVYTTKGTDGNFIEYDGEQITVIPKSEKNTYNNSLVMFATPRSDSQGGIDNMDFERLKSLVCEKFATIDSITTESDLHTTFANSKYTTGIDILFLKKRDDVFERLFSAFSIYRDRHDEIFRAHTMNLKMLQSPDKPIIQADGTILIKPGTLFEYNDNITTDTVKIIEGKNINDLPSITGKDFIYSNPFLINIVTRPSNVVGYYLNSVDVNNPVNPLYINKNSPNQFIINNMSIKRNALVGENAYKIDVSLTPSSKLTFDPFDTNKVWQNKIKVALFMDDEGEHSCYIYFDFVSYDEKLNIYKFTAELETDDGLTSNERIRVIDVYDYESHAIVTKVIPYSNLIMNICTFVEVDTPLDHQYNNIPELVDTTYTNRYYTLDFPVNLLLAFNSIKSTLSYTDDGDGDPATFGVVVDQIPLVSAYDLSIPDKFSDLIKRLNSEFDFLKDALNTIENNYSIDLKFVGTYGRSRLFEVNNDESAREKLNKLNCTLQLTIVTIVGVDNLIVSDSVKDFIQSYFEKINKDGDSTVKISNLIQELENKYPEIDHLFFKKINDYDSSYQVLINTSPANPNNVINSNAYNYIPEYITMRKEDISLRVTTIET